MLHAKENPSQEDIDSQKELFAAYIEHIRPKIDEEIPALTAKSPPIDEKSLNKYRTVGFGVEFQQLMSRCFRNFIRNSISTWVNLGQTIIISVIMDILFWNKSGYDQRMVRERTNALLGAGIYTFLHSINSVLLSCKFCSNISPIGKEIIYEGTSK